MSARIILVAMLALCCTRLLAIDLSDPAEPWRTSRTGITRQVPTPFEKLTVTGQKVSCWGRQYTLGAPLPRQITSDNEALLAGPMRVVIRQGGQTTVLADQDVRFTATAADRVEFAGEARAGNLPVQIAGWLEYDGALQVRVTASPAAPTTLERLAVEIPLRPEIARYFHVHSTWGKYIYDRIGQQPGWKWNLDWQALTWIGDNRRGLTFLTETSANWTGPQDRALEMERTADAVVFRANLIGQPTQLNGPRTWSLGLQATPGKPLPTTWHGRVVGAGGIAASAKAAQVAATGQTVALMWNNETKAFSYPEAKDEAAMRAAVKAYHDAGMTVVVYLTLSGTGSATGVMKRHRDEWLMGENGKALFEDNSGPNKDEYLTSVCPASSYSDWLVWAVDQAMTAYDLDGVYIDNAGPYYCSNTLHGCGGADVRTYPYFANRELHKRLWNVIHGRKPQTGMMWEHDSRTSNSFNLTFTDVYCDGEQFRILDKGKPEDITPTLLEITASGRQWGSQPCFLLSALNLREQYTDWLLARMLPYGNIPFIESSYMDFSRLTPVLRARRAFGLGQKTVEWYTPDAVPDWLPIKPTELLVGAYYTDRKLLLTIGNPTETQQAARLDLTKLAPKLGPAVTVTDATTGAVCPPIGPSMVLAIPANSFRVVLIEATP